MSDLNLENIVGFKAVDKNGNERQVTVDEMTELVSARIVSAASEISTFAAAAAAGTDEFEDQLPQSDTFSWLRTLDGSKNPTLTSSSAAAKVLGGLLPDSLGFFKPYTPVSGQDLDQMLNMGFYKIQPLDLSSSNPNLPEGAYPYGSLIVFDNPLDNEKRKVQIYIPNGHAYFYTRVANNGAFYKWNKFNGNEL